MIHLTKLIPTSKEGASRFGVHFLQDWWQCPFRAALKYIAPCGEEGVGLMPKTKARPLSRGDAYHVGLEEWYKSRTKTGEDNGEADIDRAVAALEARMAHLERDYEDPLEMVSDRDAVRDLVLRYHEHYGPGGVSPEFPHTRVYVDESGPWIEREIEIDLGWNGFVLTNRMDLLVLVGQNPAVLEHKTSVGSFINNLCESMKMSAQPKAELLALKSQKDLAIEASSVYLNVINSKPPKTIVKADTATRRKTVLFRRDSISHTETTLRKFHVDILHTLEWVEDMLGRYQGLLDNGEPEWEALLRVFPKNGAFNQACYSYNRHCDFWNLCQNTGREKFFSFDYNPRVRSEG